MILAAHNKIYVMWVVGHKEITNMETADQSPRTSSLHPFTEHEPTCGISSEGSRVDYQELGQYGTPLTM
jgi:hypothetical protein